MNVSNHIKRDEKEPKMLIVKVWCLPADQTEDTLSGLHLAIVAAVLGIRHSDVNLGVEDERDMVCLFPTDRMVYGLGKEIIVEVSGVNGNQVTTYDACDHVAAVIGSAVRSKYLKAKVVCKLQLDPRAGGSWTSR